MLVANRKGGVGKTPTSLILGGVLGSIRGGSVAVVEVTDDPGALGYRAEGQPQRGLGELVRDRDEIHSAGQLAGYTAPQTSFASVVASVGPRRELTGEDVARGYRQRTNLSEQMREFFISYDVLVMPVSQVPPFPADQEYPTEINGQPMSTYLDWMRSAYFISATGCPAISVPSTETVRWMRSSAMVISPDRSLRRSSARLPGR